MLVSKKVIGVVIPDKNHCAKRVRIGDATPLEIFIFNHEPDNSSDAEKFRTELLELLESSK